MICHCHSCRRLTGSTYTTVVVVPESSFNLGSSSPALSVVNKDHETGLPMSLRFCPGCGSAMFKTADADGFRGLAMVFAGTLDKEILGDDMGSVKPDMEIWTTLRAGWVPEIEGVKQWEGFPEMA